MNDIVDKTVIEWIVGQIGLAGIAATAFYLLRESYRDRIVERREFREELCRIHQARVQECEQHRADAYQYARETREAVLNSTKVLTETVIEIRNLALSVSHLIKGESDKGRHVD